MTPLLITEYRWHIIGIVTPAIVMLTTLLARGNLSVHLCVHILWKEDGSPHPSVHVSPRYLPHLLCVLSGSLPGRSRKDSDARTKAGSQYVVYISFRGIIAGKPFPFTLSSLMKARLLFFVFFFPYVPRMENWSARKVSFPYSPFTTFSMAISCDGHGSVGTYK